MSSVVPRRPLRVGFVPLTDCAPFVMARELGLFGKHGLDVELYRELGWATVRDKIIYGELDAAHALAAMPLAAVLGLGSIQCDCLTALVLNLHGNAITLSNDLWRRGVRHGASLRQEILRTRGEKTFVFGTVHPFSSHHHLLRNWLTAAGIHPDRDVRLVIVPPSQMVANLKAGHLDGFCVGEPWNSVAVQARAGWCAAVSAELAPNHPEKVLMVRREFAERRADEHLALIAALLEACEFCDAPENLGRILEVLARPEHVGTPAALLRRGFEREFDFGQGVLRAVPDFHVFHRHGANEPSSEKAAWVFQLVRASGQCKDPGALDFALGRKVFRADLFEEAVRMSRKPGSAAVSRDMNSNPNQNHYMKTQTTSKNRPSASAITRRDFIRKAAKSATLTALLAGLPKGWTGTAYASDAPETATMNFGMIALTDCSPIVIAHEKGLFKKYGISSTVTKGANWAAIRDNLSSGTIQATHMLIGMPIASTMGLAGSPKKPMIIPWILNRNGQAISVKTEWKGKVGADPKALKPFVDKAKGLGEPLTFAVTFPPGTHAMWTRYYLGAGGINPDKDVTLIVVPPAQMVSNMKIGKMDGFCVGEPWGARAIADGIGYTAVTTQDIWKDHPEKVCAFLAEFADKNPKTVKAVLKALQEASVWLDDMGNRPEQCDIVSKATYINCDAKTILGRLQGHYDYGDGRKLEDPFFMNFSARNCNYPQPKYCKWFLSQYRRWGLVSGAPDYEGITKRVMRTDIYEEAMKEIGYTHGGLNNDAETLFDGVAFDPKSDLEAYAKSFAVKNLKG